MAKKIKETKPAVELKDALYMYWETLPAKAKALPVFVLTASIDGVTGMFTSKDRSYRTDTRGLKPVQILHWMVAVQRCTAGTPDSAVEYLVHNGFTAEISGYQAAEKEPTIEEPVIQTLDESSTIDGVEIEAETE